MSAIAAFLGRLLGRREAPPEPPAPPPPVPVLAVGDAAPPRPTAAELERVLRALRAPDAEAWALALADPCRRWGISTDRRLAAFLATTLHESMSFRRLVESLDYSPAGLRGMWPHRFSAEEAERLGRRVGKPADQCAIAERAYGGRMGNGPPGSGDAWRFRGRGLIQITGRDGYRRASAALGRDFLALPAWLETREGAAESAAWWWAAHGCNELADRGDVEGWRRRVNGGLTGIEDVRARYGMALEAIGG